MTNRGNDQWPGNSHSPHFLISGLTRFPPPYQVRGYIKLGLRRGEVAAEDRMRTARRRVRTAPFGES